MIKRAYYFSAWISLLMGLVAASPKTIEKIVGSYIEGITALKTRKAQALKVLAKYMGQRGGTAEQHHEFVISISRAIPRVDPAAIDTGWRWSDRRERQKRSSSITPSSIVGRKD
jgi:hypothetical protein